MLRAAFVFVIVTAARAQTASPETQALQALVSEIRQLRQDMQSTTIATQRVQIVLYRLQIQTTLLTRASSRLDDARSSLANAQSQRKEIADRVPQMEEFVKNTQNPKERSDMENALVGTKLQLERMTADELRLQTRQIDAETQFRAEQGKLADLQDQLDRLDKLLENLTRKQP